MKVPAMTYAQRLRAQAPPEEKGDDPRPPWTLEWLDERVGLLRMPTWSVYSTKWDWSEALDRDFKTLVERRAEALIIDLRGNQGGLDDVGRQILAHLVAQPLPLDGWQRRVRFRSAPDSLLPYLDTWDPSFKSLGNDATDLRNGFFLLPKAEGAAATETITPRGARFTGPVFLIVGPENGSATFQFALAAKQHKLATLVGQPTGGNLRGTNGGAFFFVRLPRSGIEMDLPLIGYYPTGAQPDAGVEPDVKVKPTIDDIAKGRDVELDAVRGRLQRLASPSTSSGGR